MIYCDECKTESLTPGCPYCMTYKSKEIIKENKQLKQMHEAQRLKEESAKNN